MIKYDAYSSNYLKMLKAVKMQLAQILTPTALETIEEAYQIEPLTEAREFFSELNCAYIEQKKTEITVKEFAEYMDKPCYLYYMMNIYRDKVKIGISSDPVRRAKDLESANGGENVEILRTFKFENRREAQDAESALHHELDCYRMKGLNHRIATEWFTVDVVDVLKENYWDEERIKEIA